MPAVLYRENPDLRSVTESPLLAVVFVRQSSQEIERRMRKQRRPWIRWAEALLGCSLCGLPFWGSEGNDWDVVPLFNPSLLHTAYELDRTARDILRLRAKNVMKGKT